VWLLLLGLLVLMGGLFVSSGRFHSVDESAMFVAAHNLVTDGVPHTNQMGYSLWALRPGEAVNSLSPDGNLYTKKSPVMLVVLAPLIVLAKLTGLETVRVALWLGPMLLAGTAVFLYSLSRKLSYQRGTATVTTLIFAFATMALPYSQTIFGEMLAMFGLVLALWAMRQFRFTDHVSRIAFLCGVGVALAIGVNGVYVVVAMLFGLFLSIEFHVKTRSRKEHNLRNLRMLHGLLWFVLPIVLLGIGLLIYNQVRFGDWLTTGYNFAPGQEGFTTPLWWGLAGLLLSPARGLIWYSSPVILGVLGLPKFFKREKSWAWLMTAVILVQVVAFSLWWEWWGGYGWGPRFLLPTVPYLMLFALPFVEKACQGNRVAQAAVIGVSLFGVLVQVSGVDVDANRYEQWLDANHPAPPNVPLRYHHDPALVYDVSASPIFNHWQQLMAGEANNLAWLRSRVSSQLAEVSPVIEAHQRLGDVLIFVEPDLLYEVLAADLPPSYGLPYNVDPTDELAQTLFEKAIVEAQRIWLVTWYTPGDSDNWYVADLRQNWASMSDEWLGDHRLILLARPPVTKEMMPADVDFGDVHLHEYSVEWVDDLLFVMVTWGANAPMQTDYVNFVQVFDENGRLLAQQDRPPLAGYKPTSSWQVGQVVRDQYAFPLDADWQDLTVQVGWYAWPELERLPVMPHDGHQVSDNSLILDP
jgi:hypothetical protein